jgi:hypothetical protein
VTIRPTGTSFGAPFTLLLRLLPGEGVARRLVGQAVVVESGETVTIADETELLELVERLSVEQIEGGAEVVSD